MNTYLFVGSCLVAGVWLGVGIVAIDQHNHRHFPHEHAIRYRTTEYHLIADEAFSMEQDRALTYAAQRWQDGIGNPTKLTIVLERRPCPTENDAPGVGACLSPVHKVITCGSVTTAVGCTSATNNNYVSIQIDVECGTLHTLEHLMQHEIGHALGLEDTSDDKSVMYSNAECQEIQSIGSQDVTLRDVKLYLSDRQ